MLDPPINSRIEFPGSCIANPPKYVGQREMQRVPGLQFSISEVLDRQ